MKSVIAAVALGGVYGKDKNTQALGGTTYHPFSSRRRMGSQHGAQAFPALLLPRAILPHPVDAFSATLSNYSLSGSAGHEGHGGSERVRGALQHIFMWDWDSDGHDGIQSHAGAEERTMLFSLIQHERERRISLYRE